MKTASTVRGSCFSATASTIEAVFDAAPLAVENDEVDVNRHQLIWALRFDALLRKFGFKTNKGKGRSGDKMMTFKVTKFIAGSLLRPFANVTASSPGLPASAVSLMKRQIHVSRPLKHADPDSTPQDLIVDYLDGNRSGIVVLGLNRPQVR